MRKLLLALSVLAGVAALQTGANAAPLAGPLPVLDQPAHVQNAAYYPRYTRRYVYRRGPVYVARRRDWRHEYRRY